MSWFKNNDNTPQVSDADQYRNYLTSKIATARLNGHSEVKVTMRELSDNTVRKPRNVPNMLQALEGSKLQNETGHLGISKSRFVLS